MRIMGLDVGDRRIGVAISDPEETLASPITVVLRNDDEEAVKAVVELIERYRVSRIIVGLPRHLNGKLGKQATKVQDFITKVSEVSKVPLETRDEWLSTVAVSRLLREAGVSDKQQKTKRDATAAAYVLQGYLDNQRQAKGVS